MQIFGIWIKIQYFGSIIKSSIVLESKTIRSKHNEYRTALTKLRSSSHTLAIETGRHSSPKQHVHERLCQVCQCFEDETHLMIGCETNTDERSHLFTRVTRAYPAFESLPNAEKCRFFYFLVKIIKLRHGSENLSMKVLPCVHRHWMGPTK